MSDAESEPPEPESQSVPAESFSRHPLWERAAGRGPPAPKNTPKKTGTTFMPISIDSLEAQSRALLDGTSTVAPSEFGNARKKRKKKKSKKRKHVIDDDEASQKGEEGNPNGDADSASDYSADESVAGKRRRRERAKQQHTEVSEEDEDSDDGAAQDSDAEPNDGEKDDEGAQAAMLAAAAFGGSGAGSGSKKKRKEMSSALTVTDDGASVTSSQLKEAQERAFPVSGIRCIGCSAPARVQLVTEFIKGSVSMMTDESLFRSAAKVYEEQVCLPAKREGIIAPQWSWRDIKAHYTLHAVDARLQRHLNVQSLSAMRQALNMSLMRKDEQTGEVLVDKQHSELLLKTIAAHSRELAAITDCGLSDAIGPTISSGTPGKIKKTPPK